MNEQRPGRHIRKDFPFDREKERLSFEAKLGRFNKEQRVLIMEVYGYAESAHGNARRDEGTLFWTHPLGAAVNYLRAGGKDHIVVCVILLHDVPEDTNKTADLSLPYEERRKKTKEVLTRRFGQEIADGVDSLNKPKLRDVTPHTKEEVSRRAEELLSFSTWRGITAKITERLHNIRTLAPLKEERQLRTLKETMDFMDIFRSAINVSPEPEVVIKLLGQMDIAMKKAEDALVKKGYGPVIEWLHGRQP